MKVSGGFVAAAVASGVIACPAAGLTIEIDYTFDSGFLTSNSVAQAALEQAAADLSELVTTSLGAVQDTNFFDAGAGEATFDFSYSYTNPSTGSIQTLNPVSLPEDVVRVFVGAQLLPSPTLGRGGPGGTGISAGFGYGGFISDIQADTPVAWQTAKAAAEANIRRGGPVYGNLSATLVDDNGIVGPFSYDFDTGVGIGNVWFDTDSSWHFDHTTPVTPGKSDFYSVALHELIHVLGVGTADAWDDLVTNLSGAGGEWTGPEVSALVGSGTTVVDDDGVHILEGFQSVSIDTGLPQEVVMDPTITVGTRKTITELDIAFLADMGWDIALPNPGLAGDFDDDGDVDADDIDLLFANLGNADFDLTDDGNADSADLDELILNILGTAYADANLDMKVDTSDLAILAANFGTIAGWGTANFNGPGIVNTSDLAILAANFGFDGTGSALALAAVPEPAGVALLGLGLAGLAVRRR